MKLDHHKKSGVCQRARHSKGKIYKILVRDLAARWRFEPWLTSKYISEFENSDLELNIKLKNPEKKS